MNAEISENIFATYLALHSLSFDREFRVFGERNIDFRIETPAGIVLCDVKEVHDSERGSKSRLNAYSHIREDLSDLRKKFGRTKPAFPVVLVIMNFSGQFFTAHTVARAMYGDIGLESGIDANEEIHHLPRGNGSMTSVTNRAISGIFIYDCENNKHAFLSNEFAYKPLPAGYFPSVTELDLRRASGAQMLVQLSRLMYWSYSKT